jgi:hypothetical protein
MATVSIQIDFFGTGSLETRSFDGGLCSLPVSERMDRSGRSYCTRR